MSAYFFRAMVRTMTEIHYRYMIILYIVFVALIPCLEYLLSGGGDIHINSNLRPEWLLTNICFWPILGYYLEHMYDYNKCSKKSIITWLLLGLAGIAISCYMIYYMHGIIGECNEGNGQTFHGILILFPCIAIYIGLKYFFMKYDISKTLKRIIASLGGCTFGIYLIHVLVMENVVFLWDVFREKWHMNNMVAAFCFCLTVFLVGYIIVFLLKKISFIRKLI